jgi:uncharacterized double-CXXCG motif protein
MLPGVECPKCGETWSGFISYPAVDLSSLPERHELEVPRPEPHAEYARLAERVRPLCPAGEPIEPGTLFGPLHGTAQGRFGPLTLVDLWGLLVREDTLRALQAEGLRGLVPVSPVFKKPPSPPLFELQLLHRGRLHPDCLLPRPPPCGLCGRQDWRVPPDFWVESSSLPTDLDVFHLEDAVAHLLASERFVEVVLRLGTSDVLFREVQTAPPGTASDSP